MQFTLPLAQAEESLCGFTSGLRKIGYSETTLKGYCSALRKAWSLFYAETDIYTEEVSDMFIEELLPHIKISDTYKRHIKTALRRWNDYLLNKPYLYKCSGFKKSLPVQYQVLLDSYRHFLEDRRMKKATVDNYIFFATELLLSLVGQNVTDILDVRGFHIGSAVMTSGSISGFCKKVPRFLNYLHDKGVTTINLSTAIPKTLEEYKLPALYNKDELRQTLESIDVSTINGKRDYAIFLFLMAYGIRVTDLVNLNISCIDFIHDYFSFRQSKTDMLYEAVLIPEVKNAILIYLKELQPINADEPLFQRLSAPFGRMSRTSIWNVVSSRLQKAVDIFGRKHGSHAIRSSLASNLISEDVPYDVVRKVMGHSDPNATKRYAVIDIGHLRMCALECPPPTGAFKSYLEGGEWK